MDDFPYRLPARKKRPTRDHLIGVRLSKQGYDTLRIDAHKEGKSVADYVRDAVNLMRATQGKDPLK